MKRHLLLLSIAALACDREQVVLFDGSGTVVDPQSMRIEPATANINAGDAIDLRAIATFADGGDRDVTAEATWTLVPSRAGTIVKGHFQSSPDLGGVIEAHATFGTVDTKAELTAFLEIEAASEGAPANAKDRFPRDPLGDDTGAKRPLIIYPSNETMFPPNVANTRFQWRAPDDQQLFELRIDSSVAKIRYYTTDRSFLVDGRANDWIARTHAGRSLTMVVRSVGTSSVAHRSEPITLAYASDDVPGSIYYWSTGAAGIMRAGLDAKLGEKFYPQGDDKTCGSCHTISRDGRRIALAYDGEKLRIASIPDRTTLYPREADQHDDYGWGTFDPSANALLVASKGKLKLFDVAGGSSRMIELPNRIFATQPDWSPDGTQIAVVVGMDASNNKDVKGTSLAIIPVAADGTFGALRTLIEHTDPEDTIAFPSHSPDGRWIAFERTRGKSKDSKPAELYLMRADGSEPPFLLEKLNRRVKNEDGVLSVANSMPTWAPSARAGLAWIAFSSIRDYGDVLTKTDHDQLWAAAIDLDRAAAGLDPSAPAFWLPFQAIDEGNHRAFWSANPEDACPSTVEICDGTDNNCDGSIDESCCTPQPEVCNDGRDNDCDGAIDESCGCSAIENCANGIDDDCDMLIDLSDEDCSV